MSLRMRSAVPSTWKRFFSSFRKLQKLSFALSSCPVTPHHIASSILKAISHALTGPISSRSMPSNAVFYSRKLNLPNKILTLSSSQQTSTKRRGKGNRIWRHATWPKIKKALICVFLLHIASMPCIMDLDVWTRVNAENGSIRYV